MMADTSENANDLDELVALLEERRADLPLGVDRALMGLALKQLRGYQALVSTHRSGRPTVSGPDGESGCRCVTCGDGWPCPPVRAVGGAG